MKIDGVVVACYKGDVYLTRLCVASIRLWYPDLPIWLLKDLHYGDFSTCEIERYWHARVYPTSRGSLGWGFGKLHVMTESPARRLFVIDSDTVFAGPVIDRLEQFDEDLIVNEEGYDEDGLREYFFDTAELGRMDPQFQQPGWGFNTGQIVATTGRLSTDQLSGLVDWHLGRAKHPHIFKKGEQGVTNYVVQRKLQQGEITVRREPFMRWPGHLENVEHIRLADLTLPGVHRELIHWAGLAWGRRLTQMPRADILAHFDGLYYQRIPGGRYRQAWRASWSSAYHSVGKTSINALAGTRAKMRALLSAR